MEPYINQASYSIVRVHKNPIYDSLDCMEKIIYKLATQVCEIPCSVFLKSIYPIFRLDDTKNEWNISFVNQQSEHYLDSLYQLNEIPTDSMNWLEKVKLEIRQGKLPIISTDFYNMNYFSGNSKGLWGTNHFAVAVGYDEEWIYFADNLNVIDVASHSAPFSRIRIDTMRNYWNSESKVYEAEIHYEQIYTMNEKEQLQNFQRRMQEQWQDDRELKIENEVIFSGRHALELLCKTLQEGIYENTGNRFFIDQHLVSGFIEGRRIYLQCLSLYGESNSDALIDLLNQSIKNWEFVKMFVMRNSLCESEIFVKKIVSAVQKAYECELLLADELKKVQNGGCYE